MPVSVSEFWKLLVESRLAKEEQLRPLQEKFAKVKGADTQGNSITLSEWLVANGILSRYQSKVLMAGRPGPFRFGEYVVYDRHGGPFKGAFKAIQPATRQQVVLSFFTGQATQNPHWWSIVVQQMSLLSRAIHPNLCRVFQLCDTGSYKFAVLEYVRGQSAADRSAASPLRWPEAARIVRQTAQGLIRLLELGIQHGEIRPGNIWIDRQDNAKLLLPPLARDPLALPGPINFAAADPKWLATAVDYLAPELTQPGQAPNASTDIYSLGCTLYQLISGRTPFEDNDLRMKLRRHAAEVLPSLEPFGVPPLVSHVLASMTAKNPALRFQHPQLVADALGGILQQVEPAQLSWPASPAPPTQPKYEAWLEHRAIVPALPQAAAPPVAENFAGDLADPTFAPLDPGPLGVPAVLTELDTVAALAAAAIPADPPVFEAPVFEAPEFTNASTPAVVSEPPVFDPSTEARDSAAAKAERTQARRQRQRKLLLKLVGTVLACAFVGGLAFWFTRRNQLADQAAETTKPTATEADAENAGMKDENPAANTEGNSDKSAAEDSAAAANGIVADDGKTLWSAPTIGKPWSLEYIAPAAQALLFLRPADLMKHAEGEKLIAALGPRGEIAQHELEATTGPLAEIDQLTIAWVDPLTAESTGAGGWALVPMFVVRFASPRDVGQLAAQWGQAEPKREGAEQVYQSPLGAAYFPAKEKLKTLVIGPAAQVSDVIQQAGAAPPIRFELEKLLQTTDDGRLGTLLLTPGATMRPGSQFCSGELQALIEPAREFIGAGSRGVDLSFHLDGPSLFLEMRLLNPLGMMPLVAATQAKQRLEKLPESVVQLTAALKPHEYSSPVLARFPQMVKALEQFTRVGEEHEQAVLRCYLPATAAHNLALGTELALAETSGAADSAPSGTLANSAPGVGDASSGSIASKLLQKSTLSFANESLEKALNLLAEDIGVKIEILGADLQKDGITRNMQIKDLDERDKTASEILRNIMLKATPDGKLVYVIKPKQPGGEEMLFVTTRAAAAGRGDKLPADLEKAK